MKRLFVLLPCLLAVLTAAGLVLVGCEGEQGPPGTLPTTGPIITSVIAYPDSVGTSESSLFVVNAYTPDGDPMTYTWTAGSGTFTSPGEASTRWNAPATMGLVTVIVTVTDPHGSAVDTMLVGVNTYVPAVIPCYMGDNAASCGHCHNGILATWRQTPHAMAFDSAAYIPVSHRTTGFDTAIDNGGYDDNPVAALENIQCEACHGPMGPGVADHRYMSKGAFTGESCGHCHAENAEYIYSGHAHAIENEGGVEAFTSHFGAASCRGCHTSEGFAMLWDDRWAGRAMPAEANEVTCGTCHDPHVAADANHPAQLRTVAAFSIPYGGPGNPGPYSISNWGKGQICGQCHHSRVGITTIEGYMNSGTARHYPHYSGQSDMLSGRGSWELEGYTYNRGRGGDFTNTPHGDACVSCHMQTVTTPYAHANHNFYPGDVAACNVCHTPAMTTVQTEIQALLDQLGAMLPHQMVDGHPIVLSDSRTSADPTWNRQKREAAWMWQFVYRDASLGVHNAAYARDLLESAIDYMTP